MLQENELEDLFDLHNITPEARARLRWIRENAPIRSVNTGIKNTPCRFCSRKMGFVLEAEAFNTEYAAFEEYDNSDHVLEFYPQPCKLRISYINANGKLVHPDITPDIFQVCRDYFAFVECKTEEELLKLAEAQPNRYQLDGQGRWRSPPGEAAAEKLGCRFILRSSSENNWIALENYEFFADYLMVDPQNLRIATDAQSKVERRLAKSNWLTVSELLEGEGSVDSDSLYGLIVTKKVYFDFLTNRISDPDKALLFANGINALSYQVVARTSVGLRTPGITGFKAIPGRTFSWDGRPWRVVNVGDHGISAMPMTDENSPIIVELNEDQLTELARTGKLVPGKDDEDERATLVAEILRTTPTSRLKTANYCFEILFGTPDKKNPLISRSERAKAYWLANYRAAEQQFGNGYIGLIPNLNGTQGNHTQKCDPRAYELAIKAYEDYWESDAQRSAVLCHGMYANDCEAEGVTPVSLKTFQKVIKQHESHAQTKKRVGEKAAYTDEPPYLVLEYTTPRHGNRPFHIGHIDHSPLPIKIKDKSGKYLLETVWRTLLIDAYSRYVLAFYLSFDPPSYRSCMMVIRECVKRHGRIPHFTVVDNASEFNSTYFEKLLGLLKSNKKWRPKSKAKFGAVIERLFGTTFEQFISNLAGATNDMNPRSVGADVDPTLKAIWTYERLVLRLNSYFNDIYHRNIHTTLGESPASAFINGMKTFGSRQHALYAYNEDFIIETCPSTNKGDAKVGPQGVKINYLWYRSTAMDAPGVLRSRVDVRYDPDNYAIAYAYIQGCWQKCISEYYAIFQQYTEKQIRIATNHLRLKARLTGTTAPINAKTLASFLQSAEAEEVLHMQRLQDHESATVRAATNLKGSTKQETLEFPERPVTSIGITPDIPAELLEDF